MAESYGAGKWARSDVPHRDWACVGIDDLGAPDATCEMCETQEIRYVHHMQHPSYPGGLDVGCVCAGHMEQDSAAATERERVLRNAAARRRRWLERTWRQSARGNDYLKTDGFHLVVFPRGEGWGMFVTWVATGKQWQSRSLYQTKDAAKLGAFDGMIWAKSTQLPRDE